MKPRRRPFNPLPWTLGLIIVVYVILGALAYHHSL